MFYIAAAILFLALSHTASAHGCWISDVAAVPVPTADINSVSERFCVPSPLANNTSMYQIGGALIQVDIFSHGGKTGDCGMAVEYILSQSGVRGGWWNEGELQYKISRLDSFSTLSTGAQIGIAVGSTAAGLLVLGFLGAFCIWRRSKQNRNRDTGTKTGLLEVDEQSTSPTSTVVVTPFHPSSAVEVQPAQAAGLTDTSTKSVLVLSRPDASSATDPEASATATTIAPPSTVFSEPKDAGRIDDVPPGAMKPRVGEVPPTYRREWRPESEA